MFFEDAFSIEMLSRKSVFKEVKSIIALNKKGEGNDHMISEKIYLAMTRNLNVFSEGNLCRKS